MISVHAQLATRHAFALMKKIKLKTYSLCSQAIAVIFPHRIYIGIKNLPEMFSTGVEGGLILIAPPPPPPPFLNVGVLELRLPYISAPVHYTF